MHYPTKIDVACCGTRFPVKRRRVYICAPHDFTDTSVCRLSPVVVHVGDNALAEMIMAKLSTGGAACRVLCGKLSTYILSSSAPLPRSLFNCSLRAPSRHTIFKSSGC